MIASDDEWVDETEWDNMFMKMKKKGRRIVNKEKFLTDNEAI